MNRAKFFIKVVAFLVLLFAVLEIQSLRLRELKSSRKTIAVAEIEQQTERIALQLKLWSQMPNFGFRNLTSDWVFLNFLQYFGDSEIRDLTTYNLSPGFFELIVNHDPGFIDSYIYLTNSISMYAANPNESIRLMEKGLSAMSPETHPRSYFVWRHKATDELLFVENTQAAKRSYETSADWAERSTDPNAAEIAKLSRKTATFLATNPNSRPARISAWSQVLLMATDDTIRQAAVIQIEALGGTVLLARDGQVTVKYKLDK